MSKTVIDKSEQGTEKTAIHQTNGNGQGHKQEETSPPAEPEPSLVESDEPEADTPPARNGKRRRIFMIGGVGALVLAIAGTLYWVYARQFESTDDAFVE